MKPAPGVRWRKRAAVLVAVPFTLALLTPTFAAASDHLIEDSSAEAVEQPGAGQGVATETPIGEPQAEDPPAEDPPAEETAIEEPPAEEPPTTEQRAAEPRTPGPPTAEPSTEEPPRVVDGEGTAQEPQVALAPESRVTICHRTFDRTNPYNQITVTIPQANAHGVHDGPIYLPDGPPGWGDIIPPNPGVPDGQNWPEGRGILENGCEVKPDPGPLPHAAIGQVACDAGIASVAVSVSNDPDATAPAMFTIFVDHTLVQTGGPVAPGDTQTVTLAGAEIPEDQTHTVSVRSGGEVIASEVISVDCVPPPQPEVEITAELGCGEGGAEGTLSVTNNGPDSVTVTATANGEQIGEPLVVEPGATQVGLADLSQFEDETITIEVLVGNEVVATYRPSPDCELAPVPRADVAGLECPPPSATMTLSNDGDPESTVVFRILVDGNVVQESAPLFGGDTTTIVGDLTPYEDQTVTIELRANDEALGTRTIAVNCRPAIRPARGGTGGNVAPAPLATTAGVKTTAAGSAAALPATGAAFSPGLLGTAFASLALGISLIFVSSRRQGGSPRRSP